MSWNLTLDEILKATGGKLLSEHSEHVTGIGTDTRADLSGKLFIALKGDTYDAHGFLDQAVAKGAACLLVHAFEPKFAALKSEVSIVQVDDTLKALQNLGRFWRRKMKARILGVTGTNGKTTTKEFTATLLATRFSTQYSKGSLNNHWGVPLSLLSIEPEHEIAVIEMGMNHPGELKELVGIAEPNVVMVTMVGRGHLEGLGSIEAVAQAKSEIYRFAPPKSQFIFNLENKYTREMASAFAAKSAGRVLSFAGKEFLAATKNSDAKNSIAENLLANDDLFKTVDVAFKVDTSDASTITISGSIRNSAGTEVHGSAIVPVFGAHNVYNLMAAACFALACGMTPQEIWQALPECRSGWGRNQWIQTKAGARVLFDAYNANPESMKVAIENFIRLKTAGGYKGGRKIGVFGEMREMGAASPAVHRELGLLVGDAGFDQVIFIGAPHAEFKAGIGASSFKKSLLVSPSCEQLLASRVLPVLNAWDIVLMKGSRGIALEHLLMEWQPIDFKMK